MYQTVWYDGVKKNSPNMKHFSRACFLFWCQWTTCGKVVKTNTPEFHPELTLCTFRDPQIVSGCPEAYYQPPAFVGLWKNRTDEDRDAYSCFIWSLLPPQPHCYWRALSRHSSVHGLLLPTWTMGSGMAPSSVLWAHYLTSPGIAIFIRDNISNHLIKLLWGSPVR